MQDNNRYDSLTTDRQMSHKSTINRATEDVKRSIASKNQSTGVRLHEDGRDNVIRADLFDKYDTNDKMAWTDQYGHFVHQLERLKSEIAAVGNENIELANLIVDH